MKLWLVLAALLSLPAWAPGTVTGLEATVSDLAGPTIYADPAPDAGRMLGDAGTQSDAVSAERDAGPSLGLALGLTGRAFTYDGAETSNPWYRWTI